MLLKSIIKKVGLGKLIRRNVKDLSGGEKQRVAIARALVKDPKILLCDEPTGALDSKNSIEIMNLLKEISKNKLVIMVTHSEDLAKKYADRIIRIKDGKIIMDSKEYNNNYVRNKDNRYKKKRMSLLEATKLSWNNLKLRKGRTLLISIAGSIGIIGIALIISLSSGVERYINKEEEKTVTEYPITINKVSYNYKDIYLNNKNTKCSREQICSKDDISNSDEVIDAMALKENDLYNLKKYFDSNKEIIKNNYINYLYNLDLNVYSEKGNKVNPSSINFSNNNLLKDNSNNLFEEIPSDNKIRDNRFKLISGRYPNQYNEIVLVVDKDNNLNLSTLYQLDIEDVGNYYQIINSIKKKEKIKIKKIDYDFSSFINKKYKLVLNTSYYKRENGKYIIRNDTDNMIKEAEDITIVGILKDISGEGNFIGYTKELLEFVVEKNKSSSIYKEQVKNKEKNIINGEKIDNNQYENLIKTLGVIKFTEPDRIIIYANDKKEIKKIIDKYNSNKSEKDKIYYVDMMSVILETLNTVIDIITYVLTALVAISLVVSSIMIAVITYISVLERNREIGILRTMGASSRDIKRLFKTETMIEGLMAGMIGVVIAKLLTYPINSIIGKIVNVDNIAILEGDWLGLLILISVLLTVMAGVIPAKIAAKRKIVLSLRGD